MRAEAFAARLAIAAAAAAPPLLYMLIFI